MDDEINKKLSLVLASRLDAIRGAVEEVCLFAEPVLKKSGFKRDNLALCVTEALTNGIIHGNLEMPSMDEFDGDMEKFYAEISIRERDEKYSQRKLTLICDVNRDELMLISVTDEGLGFDPKSSSDELDLFDLDSSGRGVYLIKQMMDEVDWNETGNEMRMLKNLSSK